MSLNNQLNDCMRSDIASLEDKRRILQQIVDITNAIESLQDSLNAVLILGVSSKEIPEQARSLYSSLSDNLRNLPIKQIKVYFDNLEAIIRSQLEKILLYSGLDFSNGEEIEFISLSSEEEESPLDLLDEFKRTAQTAVSLRVLLRRRGVATSGSAVPVAPEMIKKQLAELDDQERQQRAKAERKIDEMQADVEKMLANPDCPDGMKDILKGVVANLQWDKKLLSSGASLSKLSFVAESQEIAGVEEIAVAETIEVTELEEAGPAVGFSSLASRWLNSPWDVSWKDIAREKK